MLKFRREDSPSDRQKSFLSPRGVSYKIAFVILPVLLAASCGKFFPSAGSLVGITVTPANPTIALSGTQQFTATGTFGDSSSKDITSSVTWTSSATNVANINSTGLATAAATGTTTITAAESGVSGLTTLTVSSSTGSLTISCSGCLSQSGSTFTATLISGTVTFTATNNGSAVTPTWTSSNTAVASIGSITGVASLLTTGSTTITATANGLTGSVTLTVQ